MVLVINWQMEESRSNIVCFVTRLMFVRNKSHFAFVDTSRLIYLRTVRI